MRALEDGGGFVAVVADVAIGVVVREQNVVFAAERDSLVEVLRRCAGARGIVRVAQEHDLRALEHLFWDMIEVSQKTVFLVHGHEIGVGAL